MNVKFRVGSYNNLINLRDYKAGEIYVTNDLSGIYMCLLDSNRFEDLNLIAIAKCNGDSDTPELPEYELVLILIKLNGGNTDYSNVLIDIEYNGNVITKTPDDKGVVSTYILYGTQYTIHAKDIQDYISPADKTFIASQSIRTIELEYIPTFIPDDQEPSDGLHLLVLCYDSTGNRIGNDFIGLTVSIQEYNLEGNLPIYKQPLDPVYTELSTEIGKTYEITLPVHDGYTVMYHPEDLIFTRTSGKQILLFSFYKKASAPSSFCMMNNGREIKTFDQLQDMKNHGINISDYIYLVFSSSNQLVFIRLRDRANNVSYNRHYQEDATNITGHNSESCYTLSDTDSWGNYQYIKENGRLYGTVILKKNADTQSKLVPAAEFALDAIETLKNADGSALNYYGYLGYPLLIFEIANNWEEISAQYLNVFGEAPSLTLFSPNASTKVWTVLQRNSANAHRYSIYKKEPSISNASKTTDAYALPFYDI